MNSRNRLFSTIGTVAVFGSVVLAPALTAFAADEETEPNNSMGKAQTISVNTEITGNLTEKSDVDWFKFEITEPGVVTLSFSSDIDKTGDAYWKAGIYDDRGNELIPVKSMYGGKNDPTLNLGLDAGTYYVRVRDRQIDFEPFTTEPYYFTVNFEASDEWETEYNETIATADKLTIGQPMSGTTRVHEDVDFYAFHLDEKANVSVKFGHDRLETDSRYWMISLVDEDGNDIDKVEPLGKAFGMQEIFSEELKAGDYYIRITDYDDFTLGYNQSDIDYGILVETGTSDSSNTSSDGVVRKAKHRNANF